MHKYLFFPLLLLLLTCLLTACPSDDPKPTSDTIAKLKRSWKVAKVTQTGNPTPLYQNPLPAGQTITEDYSRYQLAITNETDYVIIQRDNSMRTGTWELAANETKVVLDRGVTGQEMIIDLLELTEAFLKIRFTEGSTKTGNRELLMELVPAQ
jgi:hypothetical protein